MKILRTVDQGPILLVLIKNNLPGVYTASWKIPCLHTCICSYGFYLSLKAFLIFIVPFIPNWKSLNILRPVGNFYMILKQNTKIRGILGLILMGMCAMTRELYGGESIRQYEFLHMVMSLIANITFKKKVRRKFQYCVFFIIVLTLWRNNFAQSFNAF